jgi:hypothetical protein
MSRSIFGPTDAPVANSSMPLSWGWWTGYHAEVVTLANQNGAFTGRLTGEGTALGGQRLILQLGGFPQWWPPSHALQ